MRHYITSELINSVNPITVTMVGAGGTGSELVNKLARMNHAMLKLGQQGLKLQLVDDDIVTEANAGRQLFTESDIGYNKASVLISRINRFYGFAWKAIPSRILNVDQVIAHRNNILITCVDKAVTRKLFARGVGKYPNNSNYAQPQRTGYYWLDTGNDRDTGQVILGTINSIEQPESEYETADRLPNVVEEFPDMKDSKNDGPSCSLAEALEQQDLTINNMVASWAYSLLWSMLNRYYLEYRGVFINLNTMRTNPIAI